jgi:hypothetical protein
MHEEDFPTALPDDPPGVGNALGWTISVVAMTTVLLALFNAQALDAWANDLSPTPEVERIVAAASAWRGQTDRYALGAPHARVHALWKTAEDARPPTPDQR